MGASTAYHLVQKGCHDVLLLEREQFFGTQATGKCAGGIRYQFGTEINVQLSKFGLPIFHRFEEELGQPIDLRICGYLFLLTDREDGAAFYQNVEMQRCLGVETEWLERVEIAELVPAMNLEGVLGGTYNARDGLADPSGVVQGYISGARRFGSIAYDRRRSNRHLRGGRGRERCRDKQGHCLDIRGRERCGSLGRCGREDGRSGHTGRSAPSPDSGDWSDSRAARRLSFRDRFCPVPLLPS